MARDDLMTQSDSLLQFEYIRMDITTSAWTSELLIQFSSIGGRAFYIEYGDGPPRLVSCQHLYKFSSGQRAERRRPSIDFQRLLDDSVVHVFPSSLFSVSLDQFQFSVRKENEFETNGKRILFFWRVGRFSFLLFLPFFYIYFVLLCLRVDSFWPCRLFLSAGKIRQCSRVTARLQLRVRECERLGGKQHNRQPNNNCKTTSA